MMSIRANLLRWLIILFSIIWLVVTSLTYLSAQHEVEELFDAQLAQAAAVLSQIHLLDRIGDAEDFQDQHLKHEVYGHRYETKIAFQIWHDNHMILRSVSAPRENMSDQHGYLNKVIGEYNWRIFQMHDADSQRTIITAEREDVRNELIEDITLDVLLPMTFALPVLLAIIWVSIGRGLMPVNRIADQVTALSAQHLEPIEVRHAVPKEINPLLLALNSLFSKLKTAFERERRFTADAAHELQTPLASIKTQAQVAMRSTDPDELKHALKQIEEGVNRASHLLQQMLTMARYDPDNNQLPFAVMDLQALAADAIAQLEPAAYAKQLDIGLNCPQPVFATVNDAGLRIVLRNLIDNAIRYTPIQGQINVGISPESNAVKISVCNSGSGIAEPERSRVFERFYRGDNHQHIKGSGLGLSIVHRIIELHQGSITFTTDAQTGHFCVNVFLPMTQRTQK